jgi:ABC-type methionine transport system ATPase subunit
MANGKQEPDNGSLSEEDRKRLAHQQNADHERQKQALSLQRENILSQRTSNPNRRVALEAALKMIEGEIAQLS